MAAQLVVAGGVDAAWRITWKREAGACSLPGIVIEQDQLYYAGMPNFYTYYRACPGTPDPATPAR